MRRRGPYDLVLAASALATAMTVQWWAQHIEWSVEHVDIRLSQSRTERGHLFRRSVQIAGDLSSETDLAQLQRAAEACPSPRTLTNGIPVETRVLLDRRVRRGQRESFPCERPAFVDHRTVNGLDSRTRQLVGSKSGNGQDRSK
jgi:uncharacterized OsmC-like protein